MIIRRKDYSKRDPSKSASKIYIVCEGKGTEPDYFGFFVGLSSNLELIIIPPEEGTDPLKLMELAKRTLLGNSGKYSIDYRQHDQVWVVIDTDSWEEEGKITPLRNFCKETNSQITKVCKEAKPYEAWNVAQSNPSFEVWLYYHHYSDKPSKEAVGNQPSVKAYVHRLIAGGFDPQRDQVRLQSAIKNSEKNYHQQPNGNPDWFSTEQHLIGKELMTFVGSEIHKLRNKMV